MQISEFYQDLLTDELAQRCKKNPRYSVRAFARALGIDVADLSRILSGKKTPSYKTCQRIFDKLDITTLQQQRFLNSVAAKQKALRVKRISPAFKNLVPTPKPIEISNEVWQSISDWYHGAIMELTFVDDFQSDPKWIAQKLGLSEHRVRLAIKRLIRVGLFENTDGLLKKTHAQITTADKKSTSNSLKNLQKQILKKAIHSLESDPLDLRNMTAMCMSIDPKKIPTAKKMIREFTRDLCDYLEEGPRTEVYQLGVCLFPISKGS